MKSLKIILLGLSVLAVSTGISANGGDAVLGKYLPPEKDSVIEIIKCGNKYCGRTACIKDNKYPAGSKDGVPGTPYLDHNNPNANLKKRPNLGMQFLVGMEHQGNNKFKNGKVYNPRDGKTYCAEMELKGNKLMLKGHLCISSFLGKTNTWTKLTNPGMLNNPRWDCMK